MANNKTRLINQSDEPNYYTKRERAQKVNFAKIQELLQRNVSKTVNKTFTQYTKDLLKTYINSPNNNQQTLREISRFLCRNSMIYKKLLMYYASMPLFYYNVIQVNDFTKTINANKALKDYQNVLSQFENFDLQEEGYNALYMALRDGFYVGYMYNSDQDGMFLMPIDVEYVRIYGKTPEGEWICYMDASYFDKGDNKTLIYGINDDGVGTWDQDCFKKGYEDYKNQGNDFRWFRLTTENTFCLTTCPDDEFYAPLPWMLPIFCSLLDLLDLETLLMSRTELENYILLVSKIPLLDNKDGEIDDFALSLELVQQMQALIDAVVPDLIGTAYAPFDIEKIEFSKSNSTDDTNKLSEAYNNLFNNAGASQLVVSGGSSTNSIGLTHAIENDTSTDWVWVKKIESWINYYIKKNISDGYKLKIHRITWYNTEEYQTSMKDAATLGGSALDYLTALGDSPYIAFNKLNFENTIGIKDLMKPLQTSYTQSSSDNKCGAPTKSEVSEEGLKTRDENKNAETKANN